ncbi:dihydroneopterin aldolase [Legionella dresdenensis]|uniref:7,8-dihydroneopterin aldolase n=1 Tax=Legionella dresdenensis TaxID=450200 RepID=A0ABV8CE01_9GAMM
MDNLIITGLAVETRIGTYEWEQHINQKLLLDLVIPIDCANCEEDLSKTLDYARLCECITNYIESNSFQLIETVAERVAALVKSEFHVETVSVKVSKPNSVKNAANIQVAVTR